MGKETKPGLFGIKYSNRDFTKEKFWGKNQFNSSFPAALLAYMHSRGISPVYLKANKSGKLTHNHIAVKTLLGIDPLSENAFYMFERGFSNFEKYYYITQESNTTEHIDLVMLDKASNMSLVGLEIKLTALPDNTTIKLDDEHYGCEIVVRSPTICYLACSICEAYKTTAARERLRQMLNSVPKIDHWNSVTAVEPHLEAIENCIMAIAKDMNSKQTPLMVQPVWKMKGKKLADDCLDVFVWSNLSILQMCAMETRAEHKKGEISRLERVFIWVYLMLRGYVDYTHFDYRAIVKDNSYDTANDKAFSIPGVKSHRLMTCAELTHPRINKNEIRKIILGGGQNLLSPERRFDAIVVMYRHELFD